MGRSDTLIFGCGPMGQEVAEQLIGRKLPVYMYSSDLDRVAEVLAKGFDAAVLDYTDDDKLRQAGIGEWVKVIFCLFPEEAKNVFLTLSARALDLDLKIICVSESPQSGQKLFAAGASKVIDPYEISGRKMHELIARPMIVDMLEHTVFGKHLDIAEIEIPLDSCLSGYPLSALDLGRRYNVVLMGVVDVEMSDSLIFSTSGVDHKLDAGDMLVVIGPTVEITRLKGDLEEDRTDQLLGG
ncbi:MAG: TrkA family potassium uptake protein [endosymbiont of Seepiophila jonesi]|uniref:TrkA family potassium uptake protein n=1 Tax=endosymbiont of Lamellibrachia luymesi TaxID=2200907 RepID=A0A370DX76_9GAMM|nr:MAG: TrkA family potassium uptake protein [endosymbiont of Lamellibrachia luymesi]RDH92841.1 MAG: TrkA family potassium uptake protein [endosymbiont of Seepiophila jonesi]